MDVECLFIKNISYIKLLERQDNFKLSFNRTWNEYRNGFKSKNEYFIGLENIYKLTKNVDLSNSMTMILFEKLKNSKIRKKTLNFSKFSMKGNSTNYQINSRLFSTGFSVKAKFYTYDNLKNSKNFCKKNIPWWRRYNKCKKSTYNLFAKKPKWGKIKNIDKVYWLLKIVQ